MSGTARLLLGVALSAVFTGGVIQHSQRHGRLRQPPGYDDVSYFADAAQRVKYLEEHKNLGAFVKHSISSPPHSPLAAALGVIAFLVLGMKDWAPYAVNGILVLALLAMVDFLFRGRSLVFRGAMAVLALALPWTSLLVFEFRPDPACAVMVAFGVALAFEQDLFRASTRRRCAVGAAFGLAILFKPSFFVFAAALTVATFIATLLVQPSRFRETLKAWVWVVATMAVVGGPPLLLRPRYYYNYLMQGLTAPPVPHYPGGWQKQALYYLTGNPDYLMRIEHLALLGGTVLGVVAALAYRGSWDRSRLILASLIPVFAAYLIPTLSTVKQSYFGLMFAALLSFVMFRALAEVPGRQGTFVALAVTALGVWWAKPPFTWGTPSQSWVQGQWRLLDEVYAAVRERIDRPGVRIFVTATGTVSPDVLLYYCVRDSVPLPVMQNVGSGSSQETRNSLDWADLVVAPSPEAADVWPYSARARVRGETLAALRADPSFALFRTVRDTSGEPYYLFERIGPFYGFRELDGLFALEGPYPQWRLGLVRWGLGPETALTVKAETTGRYRLNLEGRSALPRVRATFLLDGQVIERHVFGDPNTFEKVEVPLDLQAGQHSLKIVYDQWMPASDGRPLAVLFNRIQILPNPGAAEAPR